MKSVATFFLDGIVLLGKSNLPDPSLVLAMRIFWRFRKGISSWFIRGIRLNFLNLWTAHLLVYLRDLKSVRRDDQYFGLLES